MVKIRMLMIEVRIGGVLRCFQWIVMSTMMSRFHQNDQGQRHPFNPKQPSR